MKKVLLLSVAVMLLGVAGWSQADPTFVGYMKATSAANGSLRKNMEAKMGPEAAADATKLAGIMGQVKAFFETNKSAGATIAAKAQADFAKVAELAGAGKVDEAAEAMKVAGANCGACHTAHREKVGDGPYSIKF
ncbi:MAG: hypothetical protein EXQ56_03110 [Acidobacteria bacterium]|nr:hypothetical protein [Acidobacteriota bacterium]